MGTYSMEMTMTSRYSKGWRDPEQDRKVRTRAAKAGSQSFTAIRDQCVAEGRLFEDPDFPALDRTVYYSQRLPQSFEWKRPTELSSEPRMFIGGATRFDVKQGELGNCWFLAAVASLCAAGNRSTANDLLHRAVPKDNSFVDRYAGIVHFNIWQYGKWVDVVIDDRLPCMNGRLMFMHSADPNEFWSALLEKAYAKLNGSYEALSGGSSSEAMEDLTGGVVETFEFQKDIPKNMWSILMKAYARRSLMACSIDATLPNPPKEKSKKHKKHRKKKDKAAGNQIESVLSNGLIVGHAYSVTAIRELDIRGHKVKLLRVRNPWGNQYEWKGSWGDKSPEWSMVSEAERQQLGISFDDDGEFWMSFQDYTSNFQKMEICNLSPDGLDDDSNKIKWQTTYQEGSWKARVNAGGCRNFLDTFWTNPQYKTEVVDADDDDDDNMGTLIVALMQKERRKKKSEGLDHLTLGFCIYKLKEQTSGPLDMNFFKYNASAARSTFSNVRELCQRFKLPPGPYVIIPSTFNPNEEGDFLMRIFSEKAVNSEEVDEETGEMEDDDEQVIRDMEAKGIISGKAASLGFANEGKERSRTINIISTTRIINIDDIDVGELENRKRRLRVRQVTQDDANQENEVRGLFKNTAGEDLEVDAFELKKIMDSQFMRVSADRSKEFRFDGFSVETCRSIVAMMDLDKSGKLGYDEFKTMWSELRQWKKIFREFDLDGSGTLNSMELRQALNSAGMRVSNMTFNGLVMRYADRSGKIEFDDYIHCAVRLKTMFATFKDMCPNGRAPAVFQLDQFIQTTMYS